MKPRRLYILLGILGLVTSITIILAIAYGELRNRETLTTKIRQAQEAAAAEEKLKNENNINVIYPDPTAINP